MSKRLPYLPEFRSRMIDLVRSGRSPEDLAKEFEPSGQTIRNWACSRFLRVQVEKSPQNRVNSIPRLKSGVA